MDISVDENHTISLKDKEASIGSLDDILPEINEDVFLYNNNDSKFLEISEISDSIVIRDSNLGNVKETEDILVDNQKEIIVEDQKALLNNIESKNLDEHLTETQLIKRKINIMPEYINENITDYEKSIHINEPSDPIMSSQAIDDLSKLSGKHTKQTTDNAQENINNNISTSIPSFKYFLQKQLFPNYYSPDANDTSYAKKCQKVSTLFKIPYELEIFSAYGILQCTNSFLQLFTFLPLRFIIANFHILSILLKIIVHTIKRPFSTNVFQQSHISSKFLTSPINSSEVCDLLKGYLLLFSTFAFYMIDTSIIYHMVRGQAIIKLYIFFNMLEVADRLCNSLGQDILESLYWAAAIESFAPDGDNVDSKDNKPKATHKKHLGLFIHFALALIYLFIHSFVILLQATTLSVAFNSHNKALLTIMISNNFVELKGNVFKKFEKANLFQMSCSDVRERFSLVIMMAIVMLRNLTEFSWSCEHFFQIFPDMVIVIIAEMLVDWVKHAFITKFNEIPHEVYQEFTTYLAKDVIGNHIIYPYGKNLHYNVNKELDTESGMENNETADLGGNKMDGDKNMKTKINLSIFTDNNCDLVCKQTGFTPLPLAVIFIKTLCQTFNASYTIFKNTEFIKEYKYENVLDYILSYINQFSSILASYYPNINILNIIIFIFIYINLFLVKVWISILVLGLAYEITSKYAH